MTVVGLLPSRGYKWLLYATMVIRCNQLMNAAGITTQRNSFIFCSILIDTTFVLHVYLGNIRKCAL